jgi:hypothetical protein
MKTVVHTGTVECSLFYMHQYKQSCRYLQDCFFFKIYCKENMYSTLEEKLQDFFP